MAANAQHNILWADDEIDLLKPHLMFLKNKGYNVTTANNGSDALEMASAQPFDLIILDENMPGLTGLETLTRIKQSLPHVPVIMITKSEEENIMDQAVGNKIADYLIKPVNPNQILIAIKKILHSDRLVADQATRDYREDFANISHLINSASTIEDWYDLYGKLVYRELELASTDTNMDEMLDMQKIEANSEFNKWVRRNYETWVTTDNHPLMSPEVLPRKVFPLLDKGEKVFFILIDNFRLDQWRTVMPLLSDMFTIEEELYTSILPTATQYARNAIFSGLMPVGIEKMFPDLWVDEDSEEGKNLNESPLIATLFDRYRRHCRFSYNKINDSAAGEKHHQRVQPPRGQRPQRHRAQLRRHAVARAHGVEDDTRARIDQRRLPLADRVVVPPFVGARTVQDHRRQGLQDCAHDRPRHHTRRQPHQDCRRPQHQHQPAL